MRIGLCGAQRTGKTTSAERLASDLGLNLVKTNTTGVFERLGVSPKVAYPIEKRLSIQEQILDYLTYEWSENDDCVFDRTPLDVLAYMEADVLRDSITDLSVQAQYLSYRQRCLEQTYRFNHIILIQPGIKLVEEEGKAQASLPYMYHFNTLMLGYLSQFYGVNGLNVHVLHESIVDLDSRALFLSKMSGKQVQYRL